jgi:hypothetical protein
MRVQMISMIGPEMTENARGMHGGEKQCDAFNAILKRLREIAEAK